MVWMNNREAYYMDKICDKIDKESQTGLENYLGSIKYPITKEKHTLPNGTEYDVYSWETDHGAF